MSAQKILNSDRSCQWAFVKDKDGYETTKTAVTSVAAFSNCVSYVWEHKWQKVRKALAKNYRQYIEEEFPWFRGIQSLFIQFIMMQNYPLKKAFLQSMGNHWTAFVS